MRVVIALVFLLINMNVALAKNNCTKIFSANNKIHNGIVLSSQSEDFQNQKVNYKDFQKW